MILRKAFFYWQYIAALALPLWLLVGWPIFGAGGWNVFGVFFGALVLGLALLIVGLLTYARKEVRETRTVSWPDTLVLALWHAAIIGVGFYAGASAWFSVSVIVIGIAAFWLAVWELYSAARRRVRAVIGLVGETATPASPQPHDLQRGHENRTAAQDPEVIVIRERPTQA